MIQGAHALINSSVDSSDSPTVFEIKEYIKNLTQAQRDLLDQVVTIFKLILIMSAINATSERSSSALRRVKTYLRSSGVTKPGPTRAWARASILKCF